MASMKQLKFYTLLLSGIAISVLGIYFFFSSSTLGSLLNLSNFSFGVLRVGNANNQTTTSSGNSIVFNKDVAITAHNQVYHISAAEATTQTQRENGLMGVKQLGANQGMLFIFNDSPQIRTFWMKNTLIPLDMLFISQGKQILSIQHDAQPCTSDPCPIYSSNFPAQYVLEVNGNWAIDNNIQPGSTVNF